MRDKLTGATQRGGGLQRGEPGGTDGQCGELALVRDERTGMPVGVRERIAPQRGFRRGGSSAGGHRTHKAYPKCALPSHTRMLAADPQAQVYEKLETETQEKGIYGCVYGSRRTFFLGEPAPSVGTPSGIEGITLETLAGSVVAYEYASAGPGRGGLGSGTGKPGSQVTSHVPGGYRGVLKGFPKWFLRG